MTVEAKVVVVLGGVGGIGFPTVQCALRDGAKYVGVVDCLDANHEHVVDCMNKLEKEFDKSKFDYYRCDLVNEQEFRACFKKINDSHSYIDVLVNTAGVLDEKNADLAIDGIYKLAVKTTLTALDFMDKNKGGNGGVILHISSVIGLSINPLLPIYCSAKHAVVAFVRAMKPVYKSLGVRILCLCPGKTDTKLIDRDIMRNKFLPYQNVDEVLSTIDNCPSQKPESVAEAIFVMIEKAEEGEIWKLVEDEIQVIPEN